MTTSPAALGLSIGHISPQRSASETASGGDVPAFRIEVAAGATLVRLRGPGSGGAPDNGGGKRGQVCGFSRKSRKRLLDELNSVPVDVLADALFITLTLPDRALEQWQEKPEKLTPGNG